ncbi:hypothetical protein OPV22_011437 [Ensete ventricosum]|uniref:Uncharacterized protein n=1 Tax=Ensete ventricosum TaxID=4639 RepID=A0AAV8Q5D0_ENSVE|nr:hypothetical protein OPV22_011437 [Ensete ventricosum]
MGYHLWLCCNHREGTGEAYLHAIGFLGCEKVVGSTHLTSLSKILVTLRAQDCIRILHCVKTKQDTESGYQLFVA